MAMKPFTVDTRIKSTVNTRYQCPRISQKWVRETCKTAIEAHGSSPTFTISAYHRAVDKAIRCTSLSETAVPGTGLPNRINHDKVNDFIEGPVVLELVHLTDIGVCALKLERVRQDRERRIYLDRIAQTNTSEGQFLRELEWLQPKLDQYPRKRLKLFLSDGFLELPAIELERLPFELGNTAMGTKIILTKVPIVGGIAYLSNENVQDLGGYVPELHKRHRSCLYDELQRRMDEDQEIARLEGIPTDDVYRSSRRG